MADFWIPMRLDLHDDPAVIAIAGSLGMDEYAVVGRLHRLWSWANRHLTTGEAAGVTADWIDRYVSSVGFAAAMLKAGWLCSTDTGVEFPRFDRWNSQGAKRRVAKTEQKRTERARRPDVANLSPSDDDTGRRRKTTIPRPLRDAVFTRDGNRCVVCGWQQGDAVPGPVLPSLYRLSVDHMIPESRGGQTVESNLVTLCMGCNQAKGNRTFEEAGMSPDLSHIVGDKTATRREEKRRKKKDPPSPPQAGGAAAPETALAVVADSPAKPPRPRNHLFDAVAEVTGADPSVSGSHIAKLAHPLAKAEPPYTPEEVREFGRRFHEFCPWAADAGRTRPTISEMEKYIGLLRAGPADVAARSPPPRNRFETQDDRTLDTIRGALE